MNPINVGKKALAKRRRKAQSTVKAAQSAIERETARTARNSAKEAGKGLARNRRNYRGGHWRRGY